MPDSWDAAMDTASRIAPLARPQNASRVGPFGPGWRCDRAAVFCGNREVPYMPKSHHEVLAAAAKDAILAPSVFNTQPWQWRIDADALELRTDRDRQLSVADPDGRLLLLSCGASLHHARVSVAAAGWCALVGRLVSTFDDNLLARVSLIEPAAVDPAVVAMHAAIAQRRTDRRPFGDEPVTPETVTRLKAAAEAERVHLHRVRLDQMPMLAIAVATAGAQEMADSAYRNELIRWTNHPEWSNDGVPSGTAVQRVPRRVPVREFAVEPQQGMPITPGGDRGATYLILYGEGEQPRYWLRAGEALSAVLLTAVALGLSVAPISDVIEVEHPRQLVRGLLGGLGHPYIVIRCGWGRSGAGLAEAPRRDAADVIAGLPLW
jgi:nitroreductase